MKYKDQFDHLGQMRFGDHMPWTKADVALFIVAFIALILIESGVLS